MYRAAASGTSGSFGFGSHSRLKIDKSTLPIVKAGDLFAGVGERGKGREGGREGGSERASERAREREREREMRGMMMRAHG